MLNNVKGLFSHRILLIPAVSFTLSVVSGWPYNWISVGCALRHGNLVISLLYQWIAQQRAGRCCRSFPSLLIVWGISVAFGQNISIRSNILLEAKHVKLLNSRTITEILKSAKLSHLTIDTHCNPTIKRTDGQQSNREAKFHAEIKETKASPIKVSIHIERNGPSITTFLLAGFLYFFWEIR